MKFNLAVLGFMLIGSAALAEKLPGSDDLSRLASGSGTYSRSFVTDIEDENSSSICSHIVKVEVAVNAAEKNVTYVYTILGKGDVLSEMTETIRVGQDSFSVFEAVNGITVYSVNGVQTNSIVTFERKDADWAGVKGEWEVYKTIIEFTAGKVKIDKCTFRKI